MLVRCPKCGALITYQGMVTNGGLLTQDGKMVDRWTITTDVAFCAGQCDFSLSGDQIAEFLLTLSSGTAKMEPELWSPDGEGGWEPRKRPDEIGHEMIEYDEIGP